MNPSTTEIPTSRRTRPLAIGVAAGVLAGGAIGLVAVSPAFTSAASDDTADTTTADTTTVDTAGPVDAEPAAGARQDPGERLRDLLQPLVDDGTIAATQADSVAEFLVENRPERPGGQRGHRGLDGHGPGRAVVADLLGIDAETLRAELLGGKSIADIAEEQGVDLQTVIDALVADAQSHLDLATDHGLDEQRAAERLEQLTERIEAGVNRTRQAHAPDG